MNVHSCKTRFRVRKEFGAGLFDYFAAGGVPDLAVFELYVAAGEEPAIQAAVVDEEQALAIGSQNETSAGNVSRSEMGAGERFGGTIEEEGNEFLTFERLAIGGIVKRLSD